MFMYVSTENLKRKIIGTAFLTPGFECFNFYSTLRFAVLTKYKLCHQKKSNSRFKHFIFKL